MKRKLFLLLCALLTMIGVQAQNPGDDYTSYITNPTFTDNANGWTIDGQARYFNGKGFDGTTNFIELTNWGSSWDATISQTVTSLPNGYYKVKAAGQMSGTADCWMKLVANGAESRFSRNGDTNGNILANGTETTIGSGVAGWRYTSVIAKVTDGTLAISCVGHSDVKERWANFDAVTLTFLGTEFAPNTDVTEYISNWDFWGCFNDEFNGWTIEKTGGNSWVHGSTAVEHWSNDLTKTFDYYQAISGLPEGRYTISASMWNTQGSGPNGNSGVYGTSNGVTAFAGVTDDCGDTDLHTYSTSIFVNNGELRLGVKNNGTRSAFWFGVDWIKLNYEGKMVQDYAVALPAGGAMAADTWYYFDITVAGNEYNATATTLGDIICTDDGNTLTSAEKGNVTLTSTDNNFAAKRYYVKSSSANNLEIGVASYTYSVSEATADKAYIQPSQTVTVSFTASTNDPDATLAQDYSGVTFDGVAINVTPGASGFTFTLPANLEAGVAHTLYIPAGAIGYEVGSTYNSEQNIELNAVALYDGVYYMRNTYFNTYISRAGNYNTQAIQDKWGLAFKVSTDANNNTKLQYFDSELWLGDDGFCYGDCSAGRVRSFNVTKVANGYKFLNTNNSKYLAVYEGQTVADSEEGGNLVGTSNVWDLESTEAHVANYTANDNAQAAAAATAAGIEGITTKAALAAELAANYEEVDINITGAKAEKYQVYPGDGKDSGPVIYYSETVENLKPGIYKLSVAAFQRAAGYDRVAAADGARSLIYLYAGDAKTQIKSVMEYGAAEAYTEGWNPDYEYKGMHYPNSQDAGYAALATGNFNNEVYVYVADAGSGTGSLEIGIKNPTRLGGNFATWSVYNTWKLTYYSEPVVAPTALTLNETALSFNAENYSATLTATPTPAEAAPEVTWSSSDESVAKVTAAGVVTGVSTGTATITATSLYDANVKATCEVTVSFTEYTGYSKTFEKDGVKYFLAEKNLVKNGNFAYPTPEYGYTGGDGNPIVVPANWTIVEDNGDNYLKSNGANTGAGDAKSFSTHWAIESGKKYVFGYTAKKDGAEQNTEYIKTSLSKSGDYSENKVLSGTGTEADPYVAIGTEWKEMSYLVDNTEGTYSYVQLRARWIGSNKLSLDKFYLAEVVGQESATGDTKTVSGEVTEDYTVIPSGDYPIVDISGATFDGTLTVDYSSNANGFVIATADQKTTLGDVKNVVVGSTCANLVLTDGFSATIPAALTSATAASYDRNVADTNVYGTVCLPFNMESNSYIQFYTVEEVDGTENVLKLETTDAVEAGVPAVFKKLTADATEISVTTANAEVVAAPVPQDGDTKLVGTFSDINVSENVEKCYYIMSNAFWQGNGNFNVKAYRAYIQTVVSEARLIIKTDGEDPTAINELKKLDEKQGLKDGKYLINGKVIVVKAGKQFYINGALNK